MAFTGQLSLIYRAPCPLGVPHEYRAWLVGRDERRLRIAANGSGRDGATIDLLSEETGVPSSTLYYNFAGKQEILVFLLQDLVCGSLPNSQRNSGGTAMMNNVVPNGIRVAIRLPSERR